MSKSATSSTPYKQKVLVVEWRREGGKTVYSATTQEFDFFDQIRHYGRGPYVSE